MKLEDQVVSLELAKRLKELGVKQESYFYWEKCSNENNEFIVTSEGIHNILSEEFGDCHSLKEKGQKIYSAFTVAELGEFFPNESNLQVNFYKSFMTNGLGLTVGYENSVFAYNTEADCRAEVVVYLIENKIIEV